MLSKEELLEKRKQIKKRIWDIEQILKNKSLVSVVDFASMYPSILRLLNAAIESLVGFLDDDPIAYRKVGLSKTFLDSKEKSKELVKTTLTDSRHVKFVGKNDEKVSLRLDLYAGKYDESTIDDITETPFERYFLASMGVFDPDQTEIKFQGKIYTVAQLNKYFKEMNYSVSGSGSVFEKTGKDGKQGLIPSYLEYMFVERKIQKKAAFGHFKNKNTLQRFRKAAIADGLYTEVKK